MATTCSQTLTGLVNKCETSKGGIKTVWLAPYDSTKRPDVEEGVITDIPAADTYVKFYFKKNTSGLESTLNIDPANGINYVTTVLSLVFTKMDTEKRIAMTALATSDLMGVVEDSNGVYHYIGYDEPVSATAGTGSTGVAKGDGNKYTIELTDESTEFPYPLADEAIAQLPA